MKNGEFGVPFKHDENLPDERNLHFIVKAATTKSYVNCLE